ncbi:MAG: hypothetical protein F4Y46_07175 [Chloroflexi bacterium]|nr:hypothetical protein [Chloroflexota bacterium]
MARTISVEEEFQRPPEEVWSALSDWNNAHRWLPGIEAMTANGETATGTELIFQARGTRRTSTIVSCDPGRSIVLRSIQGGVVADYRYEIQELGRGSSRVTLVADCGFSGLLWRLVSPLLRIAIRYSDGKQLRLLKALVEPG